MPSYGDIKTASVFYCNNTYGAPANLQDSNLNTYVQRFTYCCGDFDTAYNLAGIKIALHNSLSYAYMTTTGIKLQGSNDTTNGSDGTWADLLTFTSTNMSVPSTYPGWSDAIDVYASTAYRYYRITGTNSSSQVINEWELYASAYSMRALLSQLYDIQGEFIRQLVDQKYHLTDAILAKIDQVYGLRMLAALILYYGDAYQYRSVLDQRYSDFPAMRALLRQLYGDSFQYRTTLEQVYNLPEGLRQILAQRYGLADHQIRALIDSNYDMLNTDLVRTLLDQQYVLAAGEALVQSTALSVTCDGAAHTSAYNINLEQDEALFYMTGELQLADQAEYLQYEPFTSRVEIAVDGTTFSFIADRKRSPRSAGSNQYIVPLVSRTVLLDAPHATTEPAELTGMASALVAALAVPYTVDYQLVDWFIPAGRLQTNSEPPISIIKRIVAAAGGLVQTDPDGTLICRPEYPTPVNLWNSATPDIELTDQDDFFEVDPQSDPRDGYNMFFIADQALSLDGLYNPEVITLSERQVEIRIANVPWNDALNIALRHSGGDWVQLINQGVVEEIIDEEQVEIVAGSGTTAKPFYGLAAEPDYRETNLGELTISESGEVSSTIAGNSLVYLSYTTKYYSWLATDDQIEDVQFYPEIIE